MQVMDAEMNLGMLWISVFCVHVGSGGKGEGGREGRKEGERG